MLRLLAISVLLAFLGWCFWSLGAMAVGAVVGDDPKPKLTRLQALRQIHNRFDLRECRASERGPGIGDWAVADDDWAGEWVCILPEPKVVASFLGYRVHPCIRLVVTPFETKPNNVPTEGGYSPCSIHLTADASSLDECLWRGLQSYDVGDDKKTFLRYVPSIEPRC